MKRKMWIMALAAAVLLAFSGAALADTVKTEANTSDNTNRVGKPAMHGGWNYVWYGRYNGSPVKYRVLDNNAQQYGVPGGSLLLDCDSVLFQMSFDLDGIPNAGTDHANDWAHSDLRALLNGGSFLYRNGVFTDAERTAIASSYKAARDFYDGRGWDCLQFTPLTGEKVFLLDNAEAARRDYGYDSNTGYDNNTNEYADSRLKSGGYWLLRSPYYYCGQYYFATDNGSPMLDINGNFIYQIGDVHKRGMIGGVYSYTVEGISPAFNISRSKILFSTKITGGNREYKLTLLDDSLSVSVAEGRNVTRQGNTLTVPYTAAGSPNRLSLLIRKADGSIRYYRAMNVTGGTATAVLPDDVSLSDRAYIIAERTGGDHETDYASAPVELDVDLKTLWTVTFDARGGTVSPAQAKAGEDGRLAALPEPAYDGHVFTGWFTVPQGGTAVTVNTVYTADCTLYARWETADVIYYQTAGGAARPCSGYKKVLTADTQWTAGWYAAQGTVTVSGRVAVSGTVNLILTDGAELTMAQGLRVPQGASLIVWAQAGGTGKLECRVDLDSNNAAIGGNDGETCGTVILNGGTVTAAGGSLAACIGGGKGGAGGTVTISGGTVTASSDNSGAGIGGGKGGAGGTVTVSGGNVSVSSSDGAGIGGGYGGSGGSVTISGGIITASSEDGAGIGGGFLGAGGTVTISGGSVTASGDFGAGIGGGYNGAGGTVTISGGNVTATGRINSAGIGPGQSGSKGTVALCWTTREDSVRASSIAANTLILNASFRLTANGADKGELTQDKLGSAKNALLTPIPNDAGLAIAEGDWTLLIGGNLPLTAEAADPGQGEGVWTWESDNPAAAAVSETGNVTALGEGAAHITAHYESGTSSGEAAITVTVVDFHDVTAEVGDGTVTIEPQRAIPGEIITLTFATEEENMRLGAPAVISGEENVEVTQTGDLTYTFHMPEADAHVTAGFTPINFYWVSFSNWGGGWLQWDVYPEGALPVYNGETPTVESNDKYSFTFAGWDHEIVPVTENACYRAVYDHAVRSYAVSFVNWDGTPLQSGETLYDETPAYEGSAPVRAADGLYTYAFSGWEPEIAPVSGAAVYTAKYDATRVLSLGDNALSLTQYETLETLFTPGSDGCYVFSLATDSPNDITPSLYEGDEFLAFPSFSDDAVTCSAQLQAGHTYRLLVYCSGQDTVLTLNARLAGVYEIHLLNDDPNGYVEIGGGNTAYEGQYVWAVPSLYDWENEAYALSELIVTDENGDPVDVNVDRGFYMPASDVWVSPVFRPLYPITIQKDERVMLPMDCVSVEGLHRPWDDAKAMAGQLVDTEEMSCWPMDYVVDSASVVAADGTDVDFSLSRDQYGRAILRFTMPEQGVTVTITSSRVTFGTPDFTPPSGISTIEDEAFMGGAMRVVMIPDSCTAIGARAFRNCRYLEMIRIPAGCAIGQDAFDNCPWVYIFSAAGSPAEAYCANHDNCVFVDVAGE